ncbi:MAG: dihydrodipicolinate synthase family protein [Betaproteobacteria bacterium]
MTTFWNGVLPAITTPFNADGKVDHDFLARHVKMMIDAGCTGIVPLGSLGETATLTFAEKKEVLTTVVKAVGGRGAVVPGVAAISTDEGIAFAKMAAEVGCGGLMVLPPYVYSSDWREMKAHVSAIIRATPLPCMLYNNPLAYKTDFLPAQVADLASDHRNLVAVKESSADIRRIAAIKSLIGDRLHILVGVDDIIVEGVAAGATGWVAGLVNAYPRESVVLFDMARAGRWKELEPLHHWFLPLLKLDTVVKFVQLIKLVQEHAGIGSSRVRAPRLTLVGAELMDAEMIIKQAIASKPKFPA